MNGENKCNKMIGIIGFGEIGQSVDRVYKLSNIKAIINDPFKGLNESVSNCDIINICIPFFGFDQFKECLLNIDKRDDVIFIIHSSMPMGTLNELQKIISNVLVASPVRGVHPNLVEGLLTFEKYIGFTDKYYEDKILIKKVEDHLKMINMTSVVCRSNEAELAKIMSTTLYGLNIAAVEDIGQMCDHYKIDFDKVYTQWQRNYNEGYEKLGKPNVRRPVLTRIPNKQKVIAGHCVVPNSVILKTIEPQNVTTHMADFVLRYSNEASRVHVAKKEGDNNDSRFN